MKSALFAVTQALHEGNARIVANLLAHGSQVATPLRQAVSTRNSQEVGVEQHHDDEERTLDTVFDSLSSSFTLLSTPAL